MHVFISKRAQEKWRRKHEVCNRAGQVAVVHQIFSNCSSIIFHPFVLYCIGIMDFVGPTLLGMTQLPNIDLYKHLSNPIGRADMVFNKPYSQLTFQI